MTLSSPVPSRQTPHPAQPVGGSHAGEFGPTGQAVTLVFDLSDIAVDNLLRAFNVPAEPGPSVYYLALCHRCGEDLAQPFVDEGDRDVWAAEHLTGTGHTVQLTVDGFDDLPGLHMTGVLRRTDDATAFKFLCPADECKRWSDPYDTPQLALAAWRTHTPAATR